MVIKIRKFGRGFTLVEAILASAILCGSVMALTALSSRAMSETRLNRQYEQAAMLADRQLTCLDAIGVETFIEMGQTEGVYERIEPGYQWKVVTQSQDIDNLYLVNITVSWVDRNRPYSISVDTRLNGTGSIVETARY